MTLAPHPSGVRAAMTVKMIELAAEIARICDPLMHYDDVPTEPLWHYCGAEGCQGLIANGEIWATHYDYMNDSQELTRGEQLLLEVLEDLDANETDLTKRAIYKTCVEHYDRFKLTSEKDVYLACFTGAKDANLLTQWSGYARSGSGYALRLEPKAPSKTPGAPFAATFAMVIYGEVAFKGFVAPKLAALVNAVAHLGAPAVTYAVGRVLGQCAAFASRYKHEMWAHEREWRLAAIPMGKDWLKEIHFRTRGSNFIPYAKLDLGKTAVKQVVVGPAHAGEKNARLSAVKLLLEKHGYPRDIATASELPYRG